MDKAAIRAEVQRGLAKLTEASACTDEGRADRLITDGLAQLQRVAFKERDYTAAQRRAAAAKGNALEDGSYPINDRQDLENAARLAASGHGDVSAARELIRRRAKELGVELSSLPGFGDDDDKTRESDPRLREFLAGEKPWLTGDLLTDVCGDPDRRARENHQAALREQEALREAVRDTTGRLNPSAPTLLGKMGLA